MTTDKKQIQMKEVLGLLSVILMGFTLQIQGQTTDTVVVDLTPSSKVVVTIGDRADLETLRLYDFQALFDDIIFNLGKGNTDSARPSTEQPTNETSGDASPEVDRNQKEEIIQSDQMWKRHRSRTRHMINFDLGINNYLEDGRFPDADGSQYTVRPWGSWYVGLNSVWRTEVSRNFFLQWSAGVSWYNFKFQDDATQLTKGDDAVLFAEDPRDVNFSKSKLSLSYFNVSFLPVFDTGKHKTSTRRWHSHGSSFRLGLGPYAGYRLGSHTKQEYHENGQKEIDKERDHFFLQNLRYGARFQIGFRDVDFFFNYDLNELFADNRGPGLHAFSFGLTF